MGLRCRELYRGKAARLRPSDPGAAVARDGDIAGGRMDDSHC